MLPPQENGERLRAKITDQITHFEDNQQAQEEQVRVRIKIKVLGQDQLEEFISYRQLTEYLEENQDFPGEADLFKSRYIKPHQIPLYPSHSNYKGSFNNILVEWETGETTYEPLSLLAGDHPVTCAEFGKAHNILDQPGWKKLNRFVNTSKNLIKAIKKSRLRQVRAGIRFQVWF